MASPCVSVNPGSRTGSAGAHGEGFQAFVFQSAIDRDTATPVRTRDSTEIDEVAPGFSVTARCPDGVVEGIESIMHDWFAVGTQFHPEAASASALDIRIFEEFVDGVKLVMKKASRLAVAA